MKCPKPLSTPAANPSTKQKELLKTEPATEGRIVLASGFSEVQEANGSAKFDKVRSSRFWSRSFDKWVYEVCDGQ